MKCLILAAGYATRLYPLTENFPKPLLKVRDKAILDWLTDDIKTSGLVDEYAVISNHKFAENFREWAEGRPEDRITVLDDGTTTNETRLGAVRDIEFAVDKLGLDDDLLVVAGDNLLDFSLVKFIEYSLSKGTSCIMRFYEPSMQRLTKCGVVEVDDNDLVLGMEEKPAEPKSDLGVYALYFYKRDTLPLFAQYLAEGNPPDAPGHFPVWLYTRREVRVYPFEGECIDIGTPQSYHEVCERFAQK